MNSERILPLSVHAQKPSTLLHSCHTTRQLEVAHRAQFPNDSLMQMAGLALAQLALAIAPHARTFWIACGPGNNGGDGFAAACYLKEWGKKPLISYEDNPAQPPDATAARLRAIALGVVITSDMPTQFDACIDCLFGIGTLRPFNKVHACWINSINSTAKPVISADLPTGLNGDTGAAQNLCVKADYTLSLLTLKPGLFTADGRAYCGEVWWNSLDVGCTPLPTAHIITCAAMAKRAHNTHKGIFGDVAVLGGATGMTGAAVLAASAALHGGAGRVFVCLLGRDPPTWNTQQPELMFRPIDQLPLEAMTVVAGCGGADAIAPHLKDAIRRAQRLVLDADALNQIANAPELLRLVVQRAAQTTVLTPHPLEAARLLGSTAALVQADRLGAAQTIADQFNAVVALKGSGTIVAAPNRTPAINTSGNGLLASGGTGDALAGLIGAKLAEGMDAFEAVCDAVYRHGTVADQWDTRLAGALTASALIKLL